MYKRNLAKSMLKLTDHSPCPAYPCILYTPSLCLLKQHQETKEDPVAFLSYQQGKANEKGSVSFMGVLFACIFVP